MDEACLGGVDEAAGSDGTDGRLLLVDAANVVGSRPDGWWRDRPGAAARLVGTIAAAVVAGRVTPPVVVVLEGAARRGVREGPVVDGVDVVHAAGAGDEHLVELAATAILPGVLVSADRELRWRCAATGATSVSPRWLLDRLGNTQAIT